MEQACFLENLRRFDTMVVEEVVLSLINRGNHDSSHQKAKWYGTALV
jgi:hypothetical protein